jgi:DNA modification methylase
LQLDVIDRTVVLWSNPGELVLTPFMGVGSEVYGAVAGGRFGVGVELKPSYYRQAVKNVAEALKNQYDDMPLFSMAGMVQDERIEVSNGS